MSLVIIKYNAGNIQSVLYALERIGVQAIVTDEVSAIQSAGRVIFPGVGEASSAMLYLKERGLDQVIKQLTQPVLGICLGMQLLCTHSEENDTPCLGIFEETVKKFEVPLITNPTFKIPQIGWNSLHQLGTSLFYGIPENSYCYFVHSYYATMGTATIATSGYIHPYSAALHRDNFYGVQFHPEKSAAVGEQLLRNFIGLKDTR